MLFSLLLSLILPYFLLFSLTLCHSPCYSTRVRSSWHVLPVHPRNSTHRGTSVNSRAWRALSNHPIVPCSFSFYYICTFISASSIRLHFYQIIAFIILPLSMSPFHTSRMIPSSSRIPYIISITRPSLTS